MSKHQSGDDVDGSSSQRHEDGSTPLVASGARRSSFESIVPLPHSNDRRVIESKIIHHSITILVILIIIIIVVGILWVNQRGRLID
jgi:hypothetical protein